MNKNEFIKELSKKTGYSEKKCIEINDIIDDIFIVGKKNKEKMVEAFIDKMNVNEDEANKIYENVMSIISVEIKEKLKHPFKSQD